MYYYAQLNDDKICFAVCTTQVKINDIDAIRVETPDTKYIGMKYDNGVWK